MHSKTVSLPGAQHACANRTQTSNKNRIKGNTNCHLPPNRFYSDSKHVINRIHKYKTHSKDTLANEPIRWQYCLQVSIKQHNTIHKSRHKNKRQLHVWAMCPLRLCKLIVVCVCYHKLSSLSIACRWSSSPSIIDESLLASTSESMPDKNSETRPGQQLLHNNCYCCI